MGEANREMRREEHFAEFLLCAPGGTWTILLLPCLNLTEFCAVGATLIDHLRNLRFREVK